MSTRAVEGEHAQVSYPISIARKTLRVVPAVLMPAGGIRSIESTQISAHPEAFMMPSVPEKNWTRVVAAAAGANRSKAIVPCSLSLGTAVCGHRDVGAFVVEPSLSEFFA